MQHIKIYLSIFAVFISIGNWHESNGRIVQLDNAFNTDIKPSTINAINMLPVRFAVIGDYGLSGQAEADVAALVKGWDPNFIVTVGDNNYYLGASDTIDENIGQYYHEFIYPYMGTYGVRATENRFFPALGNHDWYTENAQPYLDYFSLPNNERYYDFVKGPVHFFVLDSDMHEPDGNSATSIQAMWLQSQLASSNSAWKVVILHHAPFSSGAHGSSITLQWPYKSWGADVVFAGHDHIYERIIIDDLPYFVNGLGGGVITGYGVPVAGSAFRYNDDFGAILVDVSEASMSIQFVTRTGLVIDSYFLGIPSTKLVNSTLPTSRTVLSGTKATIFSTIINSGTETAYEVMLSMEPAPNGLFTYRQTDCETNSIVSGQNPLLDIPPGGKRCYVLSFTPNEAFEATSVHIRAYASNTPVSKLLSGVNTWLIRSTLIDSPDIIALTTTTDFHQLSCFGAHAFAVALSNVGADAVGNITAVAHTGMAPLPLDIIIHETDPMTGEIIGDQILENVMAGETRSLGLFVEFNGCINFDPASHRIFIELLDSDNKVVGSTSTAISTNR